MVSSPKPAILLAALTATSNGLGPSLISSVMTAVGGVSALSRGLGSRLSSTPSPSSSASALLPMPSPSVSRNSAASLGKASTASGVPSPSTSSSTKSGVPSPSRSGRPTFAPSADTRLAALSCAVNWLNDRVPRCNSTTPSRKSAWMVVRIAVAGAPRGSRVSLLITALSSASVCTTAATFASATPNAATNRLMSTLGAVRSVSAPVVINASKALAIAIEFSAAVTFSLSA